MCDYGSWRWHVWLAGKCYESKFLAFVLLGPLKVPWIQHTSENVSFLLYTTLCSFEIDSKWFLLGSIHAWCKFSYCKMQGLPLAAPLREHLPYCPYFICHSASIENDLFPLILSCWASGFLYLFVCFSSFGFLFQKWLFLVLCMLVALHVVLSNCWKGNW